MYSRVTLAVKSVCVHVCVCVCVGVGVHSGSVVEAIAL